jgi:hypothetical protein
MSETLKDDWALSTADRWIGHTGIRALTERRDALIERGYERAQSRIELAELRTTRKALAEMGALYKAHLRSEIEDAANPLDVVKLQAEELADAGLDLSCLNPDDLIALRGREPGWTPWGLA